MESQINLSILIPTFNHGEYINILLDSIISQLGERKDVEVLISDNASTDETPEICFGYCQRVPLIKYKRNEYNLGFDLNVLGLIQSSIGRYSWIIGSDDWLEVRAIDTVLGCIEMFPGLSGITTEINTYGKAMENIEVLDNSSECLELKTAESIYLSKNIGYRLGFVSAHVFNTKLVKKIIEDGSVIQNRHSVHSMLSHLVRLHPSWLFISTPLVAWRSGNDSILSKEGIYKRYSIDIDAYLENVASAFGSGSRIYRGFINEQLVYCMRGYLVQAGKLGVASFRIIVDMIAKFWLYYGFWIKIAPLILLPGSLIAGISRARKKIKAR